MRILVVGGGGREHALCWAIAGSPLCDKLYCAPGNAGIAQEAECVPIAAEDLAGLVDFARRERIDFVVVGPEAPLVAGLVDRLTRSRHQVVRPDRGGRGAGRLQGLHEGPVRQVRHPHRRLWPLHRRREGEGFHPQERRAHRGEGRRPRRRQGRDHRRDRRRGRNRRRCHADGGTIRRRRDRKW